MKKKVILYILLVFLFLGCRHQHEQTDSHQHDPMSIQYTAYSPEFELFAESEIFAVGENTEILAHFTHLPGFKAIEAGSIIVRLQVAGTEVSTMQDTPLRKGIYKFNLKAVAAGKGQLCFDIKNAEGIYQVIVPDVLVWADGHEALHQPEDHETATAEGVFFPKEQSWKIDFATETPLVMPFGRVIKTTAKITAAPQDAHHLAAKTDGFVMFTSANVLEGMSVKKGQVLFTVSGSELADNNSMVRFAEAQNNFENAKMNLERIEALASDKIVSEKELQQAQNQYQNAKVVHDNLKKNFSANGQIISSPIDGFIKKLQVQNGQFVATGQTLLTVVQSKQLLLYADVQPKYAQLLNTIESVNIRSINSNETYTLEQLNGKIVSIGRAANEDNYLIPMYIQIENTASFTIGAFVEIFLRTKNENAVLSIPSSALIEEQGSFFVFVQINPEQFEKRSVKIGASDGIRSEILNGVSSDERIVTIGAMQIKLAQVAGKLDAHSGHVH